MTDLASRLKNRIQISHRWFRALLRSGRVGLGFGCRLRANCKVVTKPKTAVSTRQNVNTPPPKFVSVSKYAIWWQPRSTSRSTSHVERLNATTRLHMKRMNRLTLAFSKKVENFEAAVALHFCGLQFRAPSRQFENDASDVCWNRKQLLVLG